MDPKDSHLVPENLLSITLDQLRTYLTVTKTGSIRAAALALGREQASVDKQMLSLSHERFRDIAGEQLFQKPKQDGRAIRGRHLQFSRSAWRVAGMADEILQAVKRACEDFRIWRGTLRVGTTEFILPMIFKAYPHWVEALRSLDMELHLELVHLHSNEILPALQQQLVDIAAGPACAQEGHPPSVQEEFEFCEWYREGFHLVTNIDDPTLPNPVTLAQLAEMKIPLLMPTKGFIENVVAESLGSDWQQRLNIIEVCNDVHFSLEILKAGLYKASIICTEGIVRWARMKTSPAKLYSFQLSGIGKESVIGIFRRRTFEELYNDTHPLIVCWETFKQLQCGYSKEDRSYI